MTGGGGWITGHIAAILIVCGSATCSMLAMAIAPRFAARFIFGEELAGGAAVLIARSWSAMIFASGLLIVASAFHPGYREPVLLAAIAGKLSFVLLANAGRYRAQPAFAMAIADLIMVVLFGWYLVN
ncbi:MAG: hypothetical protein ACREHE_17135 [Rhizomicrobium sp.]